MKRMSLFLVASLCTSMFFCKDVSANLVQSGNVNKLQYSYQVNKDSFPGYIEANEHEEIGPDAFFIAGNKVFIDDTVNNRVLVYSGEEYDKAISVPWYMDIKLMYYVEEDNSLKVVYEDLRDSYVRQLLAEVTIDTGEIVGKIIELSNQDKHLTEYWFDADGELVTQYYDGNDTADAAVKQDISDGLYSSELVLASAGKNSICFQSNYYHENNKMKIQERIVISEGKNVGYALPEKNEGEFNRGNFQFAENGEIYQMVVGEKGVNIYRLYRNMSGKAIGFAEREYEQIESDNAEIMARAATYKSMSTTNIGLRAMQYFGLYWTFNSSRNSNLSVTENASWVTQPTWLTALADGADHSVVGVPYCWGGWNAETFVSNINNGMFAGNVCCDYTQRQVGGTVGMDCSGYVSVAYDLPGKYGTYTLDEPFEEVINYDTVQSYDILNKPGHHVMIVIGTYVSNGVRYVNTLEETASAGKIVQTTNRNYASLLNSGYRPMRYRYLQ
ncbi:MAG: hypothetical protein E7287_11505 [Lachnospiraceae bacterium]|nr:hypothetical protein [Lachnospiraceae bacterium]